MRLAVGVLMGLLVCTPARAAHFVDGNKLLELCGLSDEVCVAYVEGATDGLNASEWTRQCPPSSTSVQQIIEYTKKYMRDYPNRKDFPAAAIVGLAIQANFQCQVLTVVEKPAR